MAFTSYAGLREAVAGWLTRDDLTARIPDFIALAQSELNARLDHPEMVEITTLTISGETRTVPCDFAGVLAFRLNDNTVRGLTYRTMDAFDELSIGDTGNPCHYTIAGGKFVFWPIPGGSITARLRYRKRLCDIAQDGTNWVLEQFPGAYLYGALKQAAPYLIEDERLTMWNSLFEQAIDDINSAGRRQSQGAVIQTQSGISD